MEQAASPTLADDRRLFRQSILERVRDLAVDAGTPAEAFGPSIAVISVGSLTGILADVGSSSLPDFDRQTAEVATPARVTVWAACPRCGIAAPITATISAVLEVTDASAEVKIKAKAKARSHVCGQMPLPEPDQQSLNLGLLDGYELVARPLTDDEAAASLVPSAPYAVCGATAQVDVDGEQAGVVCGLVAGHSVTAELGPDWDRAHVDLNAMLAWHYAPTAAEDGEAVDVVEGDEE